MGSGFRYCYHETSSVSPVEAMNKAVLMSRSDRLVVMIDGAHMITPGVLSGAMKAFRAFDSPFSVTLPMHLGPGVQNETTAQGYNQAVEDAALPGIDWQTDGYELFNLAGAEADSSMGWFGNLLEIG